MFITIIVAVIFIVIGIWLHHTYHIGHDLMTTLGFNAKYNTTDEHGFTLLLNDVKSRLSSLTDNKDNQRAHMHST